MQIVAISAVIASGGTFTFTAPEIGYYAFEFLGQTDDNFTFEAQLTGDTSVFGHFTLPGLLLNLGSVQAVRTGAASLRFSNRAAFLDKSGTQVALQPSPNTMWTQWIYNPEALVQAVGSSDESAQNGEFAWLKPNGLEDLRSWPQDAQFNSSGALVDACTPFESVASYLICFFDIPDVDARVGMFEISFGVSTQSDDPWRGTALSLPNNEKAYAEAVRWLRAMPQFYENPSHSTQIADFLKRLAKSVLAGVVKYGPTAAKLAGEVLPMLP
jgi:hypothetical protein